MKKPSYHLSIFVNCPFDKEYLPLMNALLFTIYYCGYVPRCALEKSNSGDVRYKKILDLMSNSAHGIHDISRTEVNNKSGLPRFNMPFELGLFLGIKELGSKIHSSKNCLILDSSPYRYQKFLSDIAGNDIQAHGNDVKRIIRVTRNWISTFASKTIPAGSYIASQYLQFNKALPAMKKSLLKTASKEIEYSDYSALVSEWLREIEQPNTVKKNSN